MAFPLHTEYLKTQEPDTAPRVETEIRATPVKGKLALVEGEPGQFGVTPLTEYGRLVVNVTPGFASVRFLRDGVEMPAARNHSGYRLQVGSYRVLATAPGYSAVESRVVVRGHATAQLDLGLVPLDRPTGSLLVSTRGGPAR